MQFQAIFLFLLLVLSGCATVDTAPDLNTSSAHSGYFSSYNVQKNPRSDELLLMLSFSGGGTRASAMAYGVLSALRDSSLNTDEGSTRLIDEVDYISSVSGGSFTAAYFGLFGDRLFTDFEQVFLRQNIESKIEHRLFSFKILRQLYSKQYGVSDELARYYDEYIFKGKTLADLLGSPGPVIDINAVDISRGTRFSFSHNQLRIICADPVSIPVSRAVAASSAVPVLFSAIALENHEDECHLQIPDWIRHALKDPDIDQRRTIEAQRILSYLRPGKRKYIHLLDGGIVDNLGVRASLARTIAAGSLEQSLAMRGMDATKTIVFVVVDAANWPPATMDETLDHPSLEDIISAASSAPLVQYNRESLALLRDQFATWEKKDPARRTYLIHLNFDQLKQKEREEMLALPTSLSLDNEQVDHVIEVGKKMLISHPLFKQWMRP